MPKIIRPPKRVRNAGADLEKSLKSKERKETLDRKAKLDLGSIPTPEEVSAMAEDVRETALRTYEDLVRNSIDLRLDRMVRSTGGRELFDEMCKRIDVNQKYVDILPQWKDLANVLQMDELHTQWVEACLRPREGLTRAILEIYMKDGGTLGEVINGLIRLQCLQIVEQLKPKIKIILEEKKKNTIIQDKDEGFFSVLSTLESVFGKNDDPCPALRDYSQGLKTLDCRQELTVANFHIVEEEKLVSSFPVFDPLKHSLKGEEAKAKDKSEKDGERKTVRIVLLFAEDGKDEAEEVTNIIRGMEFEDVDVDVFRFNETTMWYQLLMNPEAALMKWAGEADFFMPILTPKFIAQVLGHQTDETGPVLPTSPIINRFMYNQLRLRYSENGCRNTSVRAIIPEEHMASIGQSKAVKTDPIFRVAWIPLNATKVTGRVNVMVQQVVEAV